MQQQPIIGASPTAVLVEALMARMMTKVDQFNDEVTALPIPTKPTILNPDRAHWTRTALLEETDELTAACMAEDVLEAADALIDGVFFALGRLTEMGVPAAAIFEAVATANLKKQRGELSKRPGSQGHDAVKPEGWTPPNHSFLLSFTLADVEKARMFDELSPVFQHITKLRAAKGSDYNNVPGGRDAYFPFGHASYAHMVNTKAMRINSLVNSMMDGRAPNYEGIYDSILDLVNYGAFYAEAITAGKLTFCTPKVAA